MGRTLKCSKCGKEVEVSDKYRCENDRYLCGACINELKKNK